ncbi:MAG: GTPase HflX [Anaerolineae bacterium]|nr:GTPase HflX [Anaerolineae bacterium]
MSLQSHQYTQDNAERAYLVGVAVRGTLPLLSVEESLEELMLLARTAGLEVVGMASQILHRIDPKTFIGMGKLEELKAETEALGVQTILFDDELSPRHQRELETAFGERYKILDRSALILDIFAMHANTREGSLQVELAQYEYLLPRLTRQWTHLERQTGGGAARGGSGGVGLRGPGEKQLEVDRRDILRRISRLKLDLEDVRAHRSRHRVSRLKAGIPVVSVVGYTNAGKSSLMKAMTGADVYVADQLFATLDPTTRKLGLPGGKEILVSDTVGFIQKLPATLVAAFRATLEEIVQSDLILHVVDSAHPNALQHIEAVEDTLAEIEVPPVPQIVVLNKRDLWETAEVEARFRDLDYDQIVVTSARQKRGIDDLLVAIETTLQKRMTPIDVTLPYQAGELIALMHQRGVIETETHLDKGVHIVGHVPPALVDRLLAAGLHPRKEGA